MDLKCESKVLYAKLFLVFGITWSLEPLSIILKKFDIDNIYAQVVDQRPKTFNVNIGLDTNNNLTFCRSSLKAPAF